MKSNCQLKAKLMVSKLTVHRHDLKYKKVAYDPLNGQNSEFTL